MRNLTLDGFDDLQLLWDISNRHGGHADQTLGGTAVAAAAAGRLRSGRGTDAGLGEVEDHTMTPGQDFIVCHREQGGRTENSIIQLFERKQRSDKYTVPTAMCMCAYD